MANVGYATLTVIPSMQGFSSRLSTGVAAPLARTGADAGKQASNRFRTSFLSGLKGIAGPMAGLFAGAAAIDFLRDAVAGASDLAESGNKVGVVFGPAADEVMRFADNAAAALGQTELEARNAASTFGTYGKAAGLAGQDLSGFSTRLTTLSSDLASFYNTSPEQAIEAIGSALRGESEPIRSYGVLLDDATLRQEALRQGLVKTTKEALTPQQKVMAAYGQILKQTKDAQGDFARTSGGLANQQRILVAQWSEMKTEVGQRLLPVLTDLTSWANDEGLPALRNVGGVVVDSAKAFDDLPGPIKAAAGALATFRLAQFLGLNPSAWSTRMRDAFSGVTTRVSLARDAYSEARTQVVRFGDSAVRVSSNVGRLSASASALSTAFMGAGGALKRGLGGLVGALGGPWGLAIAGGVSALALFASKHQQAAQDAEALKASLDQQTGAITQNSREWAANKLADAGFIDDVRQLGLNAGEVTAAMLGQGDAADALTNKLQGIVDAGREANYQTGQVEYSPDARAAQEFIDLIQDTNGTLDEQRDKIRFVAEASRRNNDVTQQAAQFTQTAEQAQRDYNDRMAESRGEIDKARNAVLKLIDAYNEQRESSVENRRDQVGLQQAMIDAREEARKGRDTLDQSTQAGINNWNALIDLSDQWNQSTKRVQNAKGAWKEIRQSFIDTAVEMGTSRKRAEALADEMLNIPKRVGVKVDDKEISAAQKRAKALKEMIEELQRLGRIRLRTLAPSSGRTGPGAQRFASGGLVGGVGSGRSDSNLALLSRGEFVQPKASVDKYGLGLMRAIQRGDFKAGGGGGGVNIHIGQVVAHDYGDFMRQVQRRQRQNNAGGVSFS